MKATVYHRKEFCWQRPVPALNPEDLVAVATVEIPDGTPVGDALEICFEKTNHIDHDWTENPEVEALAEKVRSTSVGDAVFIDDMMFHCMPVGWEMVAIRVGNHDRS